MLVDRSAATPMKRRRHSAGLHRRNSEAPNRNLEAPIRNLEGAKQPFWLAGACRLRRWPKRG